MSRNGARYHNLTKFPVERPRSSRRAFNATTCSWALVSAPLRTGRVRRRARRGYHGGRS